MRKICFTILTVFFIVLAIPISAQIDFKVNIDTQPIWGPIGYDEVQYYYLPEIETYYYVPQHQFIYMENGEWLRSSNLPILHTNYDLYKGYKVVLNEDSPYKRHKDHKSKYFYYKDKHDQRIIRDSHDSKYYVNKNHPEHNNWKKQQKDNKGKHNKVNNGKKNKRK